MDRNTWNGDEVQFEQEARQEGSGFVTWKSLLQLAAIGTIDAITFAIGAMSNTFGIYFVFSASPNLEGRTGNKSSREEGKGGGEADHHRVTCQDSSPKSEPATKMLVQCVRKHLIYHMT